MNGSIGLHVKKKYNFWDVNPHVTCEYLDDKNRLNRGLWNFILTAHNWQKWKRVFLTCPCHEIYRDEAVGLKSCKCTLKTTSFVLYMWNLGQFCEKIDILSITP